VKVKLSPICCVESWLWGYQATEQKNKGVQQYKVVVAFFLSKILHTFSVGDRSELLAGQPCLRSTFSAGMRRMWCFIVLLKSALASLGKMSS